MSPPGIDRKISSTTIDMITKQLGKKADEPWVRDVLTLHKEDIAEAKEIALSVKNKFENRTCRQEKTIEEMMKTINGFKNVKLIGVISAVVLVLGWASQFYTLKDKADDTADAMVKVERSFKTIKVSTEQNAVMFKEHIVKVEKEKIKAAIVKEEDKKKDKEDLNTILKAIKKSGRR